jgi:hypothetical protein
MMLNDVLSLDHSKYGRKKTPYTLDDVYGIIYRIYCIPEDKSYIGQTFSHALYKTSLSRYAILRRCKQHYADKGKEMHKKRPLYAALNKYPTSQFIVFGECKVRGKDLANINKIEGEYMKKYNSLNPNGYNLEEVGKKYGNVLKQLAEHHGFTIEHNNYTDKTRDRRCKDVCIGKYFGVSKRELTKTKILELLGSIDIESVKLVSTNELRIIIKERDEVDNIRIYFKGSNKECLEYAKQIQADELIISESFKGDTCYKYQNKLDKVLNDNRIFKVTGNRYENKSNGAWTYKFGFHGKNEEFTACNFHNISFGGKAQKFEVTMENARDFIERYKAKASSRVVYKLTNIE